MRDRHWQSLSEQLQTPLTMDKDFVLSKALDMGLMSKLDIIVKVCNHPYVYRYWCCMHQQQLLYQVLISLTCFAVHQRTASSGRQLLHNAEQLCLTGL